MPSRCRSELVRRPHVYHHGVLAVIIEHGLPFQPCRQIPTRRYLHIEAAAEIQARRPTAYVIDHQTGLGVERPAAPHMEYVLSVTTHLNRTTVVKQSHQRRLDTPMVRKTVTADSAETNNRARVSVDTHARAYRPTAGILRRHRNSEHSRYGQDQQFFHIFYFWDWVHKVNISIKNCFIKLNQPVCSIRRHTDAVPRAQTLMRKPYTVNRPFRIRELPHIPHQNAGAANEKRPQAYMPAASR